MLSAFKGLPRSSRYVGGAALIGLVIFGSYHAAIAVLEGKAAYRDYIDNGKVYFERTVNASTVALAQENLASALRWTKANYPQNSFEYRNLQAAHIALKSQPSSLASSLVMPASVQNAIKVTAATIDQEQEGKYDAIQQLSGILFFVWVGTPVLGVYYVYLFKLDD